MLQGMTAHFLVDGAFVLKPGDTCLVHAAAGGVGLLLIQMAKQKGARVIGTCSTAEKAALARGAGADEVVLYSQQDFEAEARRLTDGRGVDVVYDSWAGHVREEPVQPAPPGHDGPLRPVQRPGGPLRPRCCSRRRARSS